MNKKKTTYNKDGTPRKNGSGRKVGSNSFVRVTFEELKQYIGEKTPMSVSRVWLENLGIFSSHTEIKKKPKIELTDNEDSDTVVYSLKNFNNE